MNNIFAWVSVGFRYLFIIVIYCFLYQIIKLMIMDIKIQSETNESGAYIKLINKRESLPYSLKEYYSLIPSPFTIGRNSNNRLVLKDAFVSKKHCEIIEDEGCFFLKDLDSSNGTIYNGEKLEDIVKLKDGDKISIGNVSFLFVDG